MNKNVLLVGGLLAAGLVAFWLSRPLEKNTADTPTASWGISASKTIATPSDAASRSTTGNSSPALITYANYQSAYGPLPKSLEGTTVPFFLKVDKNGNLIVTNDLRKLFDYFFAAQGEEPNNIILARIRELLTARLPPPARERALAILDQYLALKTQEADMTRQWGEAHKTSDQQSDIGDLVEAIRQMRASLLDAETYQAFYRTEDKRNDYAIRQREILHDKSLTPEQRVAEMEAAEDLLPPEERDARRMERQTQQLDEHIAQARAAGASDDDIFTMREAVYGADVAQRYAEADQQQAQWNSRISSYRAQRAAILNTTSLSEQDKTAQIESLRASLFNELERKRIPVIDEMMDAGQ